MYSWPDDLVEAVGGSSVVVRGGFEYDGREIVPFDADATRTYLESIRGQVDAVAVSAVFSPISAAHELRAAEIARERAGR